MGRFTEPLPLPAHARARLQQLAFSGSFSTLLIDGGKNSLPLLFVAQQGPARSPPHLHFKALPDAAKHGVQKGARVFQDLQEAVGIARAGGGRGDPPVQDALPSTDSCGLPACHDGHWAEVRVRCGSGKSEIVSCG